MKRGADGSETDGRVQSLKEEEQEESCEVRGVELSEKTKTAALAVT